MPEERWVWMLSGGEGPNSWDLGKQMASKPKRICLSSVNLNASPMS